MSSQLGAEHSTRRAVLTGTGLAAAAGVVLAGCGRSKPAPPPVSHQHQQRDVVVLNRLLAIEQESVAAYEAGIPLLEGQIAKDAVQFLSDELSHTSELRGLVTRQGGKPVDPQRSYRFGSPTSGSDVLALLHTIERRQIAAYVQAIPLVEPGGARSALAAILANDAQHVALIRDAQHEPPLVGPFVDGTV